MEEGGRERGVGGGVRGAGEKSGGESSSQSCLLNHCHMGAKWRNRETTQGIT